MSAGADWGNAALIRAAATRFRSEPLLVSPTATTTYGQAWPLIEETAGHIRELGAEGAAAVLLPNCADYVLALLGIGAAGWARTALNVMDALDSHLYKLGVSKASVLITTPQLLEDLGGPEELARRSEVSTVLLAEPGSHGPFRPLRLRAPHPLDREWAEQIANVYQLGFTGGTTGRPKAVTLTPRNIRFLTAQLWSEVKQPGPGDVFHALTPYSHASGAFVLPFALRGAALSGEARADVAAFCAAVDDGYLSEYRVSTFVVPTLLQRLVDHVETAAEPWRRKSQDWFDTVVYGAAPTPAEVALRAGELFGPSLVQIYAQAEVPMVVATMGPADLHRHGTRTGACVGRSSPLVQMWIRRPDGSPADQGEIGEICARADHVMEGYWQNESETAPKQDGRSVRTNDLGYLDDDGVLWIVGRNRDMIITGGFNVYPSQVEEKLQTSPAVQSVLVAGIPDPRWGEAVIAGVVLAADHEREAAVEQLQELAREQLASFERPKGYVVLDTLPVTNLGKPDRDAFRAHAIAVFTEELP